MLTRATLGDQHLGQGGSLLLAGVEHLGPDLRRRQIDEALLVQQRCLTHPDTEGRAPFAAYCRVESYNGPSSMQLPFFVIGTHTVTAPEQEPPYPSSAVKKT